MGIEEWDMFDIRIARPDDASGIASVHVSTWRTAYRGLVDDAHLDGLRDDVFAEGTMSRRGAIRAIRLARAVA